MNARKILSCLALPLLMSVNAYAQDFPNKTLTIQVPWPAGGSVDVAVRALAAELKNQWPQQSVLVENTVGAGGSIGTVKALSAPPDGHTLIGSSQMEMIFAPLVYQSATYKPQDAKTVSLLGYASMMMVVRKDLPVQNLSDLAKRMQSTTEKPLSFCTPGAGTIYHFVMEQIASNLKGQALHVPYAGFGQCLNDMAGGVVDVSLMPIAGPIPGFVDKGVIRAIAVFNDKPSPRLPNVPLANATKGFENYNHVLWSALHVSNKVPDAVVAKMHAAVQTALSKPELRKAIEAPGATVFEPMSPQQAHAFYLKDAENMEKMAKMVGVTKK